MKERNTESMAQDQARDGKLRVMSIMAHQDDFEFCAAGTFAILRDAYGDDVELKVLATTTGASGHHEAGLDEVFARRDREARTSAGMIGASYECLRQLDGSHISGQVFVNRNVLGGLWNAIRAFEPDAIFCPPVVTDPLAGVHIDHVHTATAVRLVAYQIIVPNAFPTIGGPRKQWVERPLVLNVDDNYAQEGEWSIRQDIDAVYEQKERMALCHESQIFEWLASDRGRSRTITADQWREKFRARHRRLNERMGFSDDERMCEYFRITRWGRAPRSGEIERLFPRLIGTR